MYFWQILHLDENELLYKFFLAQSLRPGKNDWVLQIGKDKKDIELDMSDDQVRNLSKNKFKSIINSKINLHVKKYLQNIQARQTKTRHLKISESLEPAKYLSSKKLNVPEIQTLFRLRSRMVNVKGNHGSSYKNNMSCRTCFLQPETQEHLFNCDVIRGALPELDFDVVKYQMIYGNLEGQENFTKIYHLMLQARNDLMNTDGDA